MIASLVPYNHHAKCHDGAWEPAGRRFRDGRIASLTTFFDTAYALNLAAPG
jgi:hypothetical protein